MLITSVPLGDKTSLFATQVPHLLPRVSKEDKQISILFGLHRLGLHKNLSFFVAAIISKLFLFFFLNFLLPKIVAFIA